eukprot:2245744-Pyramimonas_sp.AAC.1
MLADALHKCHRGRANARGRVTQVSPRRRRSPEHLRADVGGGVRPRPVVREVAVKVHPRARPHP